MSQLAYREVRPKKIVNVHKHVDPWFWTKYSAHPYVGCRTGCAFCYFRGGQYLGRRDPVAFDSLIEVKANAPELLERELVGLAPDAIFCGDWQLPAEKAYGLSRRMLVALTQHDLPLVIIERSPLLLRDIDLLTEIHRRSGVAVLLSFVGPEDTWKRVFEYRAASVKLRLDMMRRLADAGIPVGTALMPAIPGLVGPEHIETMVALTADHGGRFALAGGLTMSGVQGEYTLAAADRLDPALARRLATLYIDAQGQLVHSPPHATTAALGRWMRTACARAGIADRMPRPISPIERRVNKRIAERLFLRVYELELEESETSRIWSYRKAAWAVDEWKEDLASLYQREGLAGLRTLPGIGERISGLIASWLASGS